MAKAASPTSTIFFHGQNLVLPPLAKGLSWRLDEDSSASPIEVSLSATVELDALHRDGYVLDTRNLVVFGSEGTIVLAKDHVTVETEELITQETVTILASALEVDLMEKTEAKIDELVELGCMRKVLVTTLSASSLPPAPLSFVEKMLNLGERTKNLLLSLKSYSRKPARGKGRHL